VLAGGPLRDEDTRATVGVVEQRRRDHADACLRRAVRHLRLLHARQRAVAVLVLLARAAGARLVAADLALAAHEGALSVRGRRQWQATPSRSSPARGPAGHTGAGEAPQWCSRGSDRGTVRRRKLQLPARERRLHLRMLGLQGAHEVLPALLLLALDLLLRPYFDLGEHRDRIELHAAEHRLEKLERLALVREAVILLCVPAQVNALPQVIHRGEVIAPVLIERTQH